MNRSALLVLVSLITPGVLLTCVACGSPQAQVAATTATHKATLDIAGMTCASCSVTVKTAVKRLDGLVSINVDVDAGQATVTYAGDTLTAEQIAQAISDAGYQTTVAFSGTI